MDLISVERVKLMHPVARGSALKCLELMDKISGMQNRVRYVSTLRTFKEQMELHKAHLKGGPIAAPAGLSYHNYGLAFDICLLGEGGKTASWNVREDLDRDGQSDWMEFVAIAEAVGFEWGGRWQGKKQDRPHFQLTKINGRRVTIGSLLERYNQKKVDANGYVII